MTPARSDHDAPPDPSPGDSGVGGITERAGVCTRTNFGAGWYAVAASGQKVEESQSSGAGYGSNGGW